MELEHGHSRKEIRARLSESQGPNYLRDAIYGGIDGAVTTFAIVSGVAGAGLSPKIIVALGVANILADGFSMAAGNFVGTKAEHDNKKRLEAVEARHINMCAEGETEEVKQILSRWGLKGGVLNSATKSVCNDKSKWIQLMLREEYGLSENIPEPKRAAVTTFLAFLAAGSVPLMPFVLAFENAFVVATVLTATVFFAIGAIKSCWSLATWLWSGAETLAIGAMAASIAYFVGGLFHF